jgi:uncharacterized protein (TIGR03118 family)
MNRGLFATLLGISMLAIAPLATAQSNNAYVQHNLVSDIPGLADVTDPNLINPWGISASATSPMWVSNNGKGNSTLYNGAGTITALVVAIPAAKSGATGTPTGQVNNGTAGFVLSTGAKAGFIFVTEDGTISAFGPNPATVVVDNSASGAVYTGIAIGTSALGPTLYIANFNSGNIDVFDGKFAPATVAGGFKDPAIPAGYAPFNIQNLGGKLYVMYAKQDAQKHEEVVGPGNGFVSVFDQDGKLLSHLVSNGVLNAPWGVAIAPKNWGAFGGSLLIGNFGDGKINAFDQTTGASLGTLHKPDGSNLTNSGLWAIQFGNSRSGDVNTLYFVAGIQGEQHGLFGAIAPVSTVLTVTNGASNLAGNIAPGEIVVLTGLDIGPFPLAANAIPAAGALGTTVANTSATVNGINAPVLYASASATSIIVPYGVTGSVANIVLKFGDQTASAVANVAAAAPGVFTSDASGAGSLLAFNQDGTQNTATNAAAKGTAVVFYATGEGLVSPPGVDGAITGRFLKVPVAAYSLTIGGQTAQVNYAGSAPGTVGGLMEIEAVIPAGAATGSAAVVLTVNGVQSQAGVTIAVK